MEKFNLVNECAISHNVEPEFLIEIIELDEPGNYASGNLMFEDVFDEVFIKGRHFVFKIEDSFLPFIDPDKMFLYRSICRRAGKWYKARVIAGFVKLNEKQERENIMEDADFKLQPSDKEGCWIVAHKSSGFIIEFHEGYFNETQQVINLSDFKIDSSNMMAVARILRETAEWLVRNNNELLI